MRRGARGALAIGVAALVAACASAHPAAFHPEGVNPAGGSSAASPDLPRLARTSSQRVTWPPFGRNVRVIMPGWLPADTSEVPAVIAAKNFLLAFLYAEYRSNQDNRWSVYVAGSVAGALRSELVRPDVTTESFTGTIRYSQLSAFSDPVLPGAIDVSECFDNAGSANVGLQTGQVIPDTTPPDQHYYRNTDALARDATGQWRVVTIYPVIYYPQAKECKP
jgi:hypothetical protein